MSKKPPVNAPEEAEISPLDMQRGVVLKHLYDEVKQSVVLYVDPSQKDHVFQTTLGERKELSHVCDTLFNSLDHLLSQPPLRHLPPRTMEQVGSLALFLMLGSLPEARLASGHELPMIEKDKIASILWEMSPDAFFAPEREPYEHILELTRYYDAIYSPIILHDQPDHAKHGGSTLRQHDGSDSPTHNFSLTDKNEILIRARNLMEINLYPMRDANLVIPPVPRRLHDAVYRLIDRVADHSNQPPFMLHDRQQLTYFIFTAIKAAANGTMTAKQFDAAFADDGPLLQEYLNVARHMPRNEVEANTISARGTQQPTIDYKRLN